MQKFVFLTLTVFFSCKSAVNSLSSSRFTMRKSQVFTENFSILCCLGHDLVVLPVKNFGGTMRCGPWSFSWLNGRVEKYKLIIGVLKCYLVFKLSCEWTKMRVHGWRLFHMLLGVMYWCSLFKALVIVNRCLYCFRIISRSEKER